MKNLALVMFSGQTHLDFVGFYDCMLRLKAVRPQLEMRFCSRERQVLDSGGLTIDAGEITTDLGGFDAVFVPGGTATRRLKDDAGFISWLATARDAKYKFSVCTGSLLLGAAGFLRGRRATTHPFCYDLALLRGRGARAARMREPARRRRDHHRWRREQLYRAWTLRDREICRRLCARGCRCGDGLSVLRRGCGHI